MPLKIPIFFGNPSLSQKLFRFSESMDVNTCSAVKANKSFLYGVVTVVNMDLSGYYMDFFKLLLGFVPVLPLALSFYFNQFRPGY